MWQLFQLFLMFVWKSCRLVFILEKVNILVGMRDQAFSAGIERLMRALLFLSMELTWVPLKLLIRITIAACYSGKYSALMFLFLSFFGWKKVYSELRIIYKMLKLAFWKFQKGKNNQYSITLCSKLLQFSFYLFLGWNVLNNKSLPQYKEDISFIEWWWQFF